MFKDEQDQREMTDSEILSHKQIRHPLRESQLDPNAAEWHPIRDISRDTKQSSTPYVTNLHSKQPLSDHDMLNEKTC